MNRIPLFRAVHRVMFLAGSVQALAVMLLWAVDLGARRAGLWGAPDWPLPAPWLHGLLSLYGIFPFFIFGFILTAGPRWQGEAETPARVYLPACALLASGWGLFWVGLAAPLMAPVTLSTGLVLVLAGWGVVLRFLWQVANRPNDERRHIRLVAAALSCGAAGLAAFAAYVVTGVAILARLALEIGLWAFLLPVFITVLHRMLPFFSSGVIRGYVVARPFWALVILLLASIVHGALVLVELPHWTWLADLPAAVSAFHLTLLWRLRASFVSPILAVLHVGFAWCGIGFALFAAHALLLMSGGAGLAGLGLAPLHAITLGFLASTLIGMATRVTQGHSGMQVAGDAVMWGSFWALQGAALLRIGAEFITLPGLFNLSFIAALLWLAAFGIWVAKYAPSTWRPRSDGRPG